MKNIFTIVSIFYLVLTCSIVNAQQNCPGEKVKVFKGANGCGCQCMKECVTPAELPTYLANGWNTTGCWNCCKFKNWVEAGIPKASIDLVNNTDPGLLTVAFTLAAESDVKIRVTDMAGRYIATIADGYREDLDNELLWDKSTLSPGVYLVTMEAGTFIDTKVLSVMN